jgi:EAL domain-containing protein (putative c-di-GMP-specific phosphodiesterase class I)
MAFQPIVNLRTRSVFAFEALVRGLAQEPAAAVMAQLNQENLYAFDQACRVRSIELASRLGLVATGAMLSINFIPSAVYRPEACIRSTVQAATRLNFPLDRVMFEITEGEKIRDHAHLSAIIGEYKRRGFLTAIDDFGAGYAGLNLLAQFQPDILKIDMELTRNIHERRASRAIVAAILSVCRELGIRPIAEGIETREELRALEDLGMELFQGYLFARPGFEALPVATYPEHASRKEADSLRE